MKILILVAVIFLLNACTTDTHSNNEGFYTWIDASGNVRTEQRKAKSDKATVKGPEAKEPETESKNQFDPADFTPSEQVDKQLQGDKLFTWVEDGRQIVSEPSQDQLTESDQAQDSNAKLDIRSSHSGLIDTTPLKKGKIYQYSGIFEREIDLSEYYSYSDVLERDYLLIDLFELNASNLNIRTFAKEQAIAFPHFIQLDKELSIVSESEVNWSGYNHESWSSYGYLTGQLRLTPNTAFLLVMTRTDAGAMEVDGELIRLVDLGSLEIAINE